MQKIKEGENPFRQVYLAGDKILKIQEFSDEAILKYGSAHPNQFARCLSSWKEGKLHYYLYEKLDYVLETMKLNPKQLYSMMCQVALIVRQLRKNGWAWSDFHEGNMGAEKCAGSVTIDGTTIPSHGYRFKIIDFGDFIHKSDKKKREDHKRFSDAKFFGAYLWPRLVPSIMNKKSPMKTEYKELFNISDWAATEAVFEALKGKKSNVPLDDIVFFAVHGICSDDSIAYLKKRL